jgi:hypothetical protein
MTGHRRHVLTGISLGAAVATFSLAMSFDAAAAMPVTGATIHAAQAGIAQVEKAQWGPGWGGPGWGRPGWGGPGWGAPGWGGGRRVCFWRRGRRVCAWR